MEELKELQVFLAATIADTFLKDRKTEIELKIINGEPEFRVRIFKEHESYSEEFTAADTTVERCKKRLAFEVEMLLTK
jgi:hypothetical protein